MTVRTSEMVFWISMFCGRYDTEGWLYVHNGLIEKWQKEAADKFRYVMWGSLDEPENIPPKGEFFCKERASWMPEINGRCAFFSCEGNFVRVRLGSYHEGFDSVEDWWEKVLGFVRKGNPNVGCLDL